MSLWDKETLSFENFSYILLKELGKPIRVKSMFFSLLFFFFFFALVGKRA